MGHMEKEESEEGVLEEEESEKEESEEEGDWRGGGIGGFAGKAATAIARF